MKKMHTLTVNGNAYQISDPGAVSFTEVQSLTPEQQQQAKENLGMGGQYELIEDITLDEDVTSFSRTTDPNGVPYDFSAIKMYVKVPAYADISASKGRCIFSTKNAAKAYIVYEWCTMLGKTERWTAFSARNEGGLIECYTSAAESGGSASLAMRPYHVVSAWENACQIAITTTANDVVIPAGTRIQIYAVRG